MFQKVYIFSKRLDSYIFNFQPTLNFNVEKLNSKQREKKKLNYMLVINKLVLFGILINKNIEISKFSDIE